MDTRLTPLTPKIQVPVLYEDENCVVFNKPSGLLVIPTDKNEHHTLVNIVNQQQGGQGHLYPAHRLDRDTSGVILFAKGKDCRQKLMQFFKDYEWVKTNGYKLMVPQRHWDFFLKSNPEPGS